MRAQHYEKSVVPLVAHVIYRLGVGGMENGLVNLINLMPPERYRHVIICLTESTEFRFRLQRRDVPVIELKKKDGNDLSLHARLWRMFRSLQPAIVHTRNLPSLEFQIAAALARVQGRIHGEHGRDMIDLDGVSVKYNLLRKVVRPLIHRYVAVSADLARWLVNTVGVQDQQVRQIYNGVDSDRFKPRRGERPQLGPEGFFTPAAFVVGTVGRMEAVKDQLTLVKAFIRLVENDRVLRSKARLVMIGGGQFKAEAERLLAQTGTEHLAWLPGERDDIPELMTCFDLFALPSLREGISNTILEAMASGLPVVATRVGGNPEIIDEGHTGLFVSPADPEAMAEAIRLYLADASMRSRHGLNGRKRIEERYSLQTMVNAYLAVYDGVLSNRFDQLPKARKVA